MPIVNQLQNVDSLACEHNLLQHSFIISTVTWIAEKILEILEQVFSAMPSDLRQQFLGIAQNIDYFSYTVHK